MIGGGLLLIGILIGMVACLPSSSPNTVIAQVTAVHTTISQATLDQKSSPIVMPFPTPTAVPVKEGRILFVSSRDGNGEIYVMNDDGSNQTNLTNNLAPEGNARWSPDGAKIAYASQHDGRIQILVMNADGTGAIQLTNYELGGQTPSWSPDGTKIAFDRGRQIFVMNADGSSPERLTDGLGFLNYPSWSPDGKRIAYVYRRFVTSKSILHIMDADGRNTLQLDGISPVITYPAWSPDATQIAFVGEHNQIYVVNVDGTDLLQVTDLPGVIADIAWSPDGKKFAFSSTLDNPQPYTCFDTQTCTFDIYTVNMSGGNVTRLTTTGNNLSPAWEP